MPAIPPIPTEADPAREPGAPTPEQAAIIDELMAQPIKGRPQITVVGDDAISGINPLPQSPQRSPPKTDA